jgi:hypothetical protein
LWTVQKTTRDGHAAALAAGFIRTLRETPTVQGVPVIVLSTDDAQVLKAQVAPTVRWVEWSSLSHLTG